MGKKPDGSLGEFSVAVSFPAHHKTDTVGMGISPSGKFIASCNDKTELIIWNLKGDILEKIGQSQVSTINKSSLLNFLQTPSTTSPTAARCRLMESLSQPPGLLLM